MSALIVYYDVPLNKVKAYSVIYRGIKLTKDLQDVFGTSFISGLKQMGALPINKSVWIVNSSNVIAVKKLQQYLSNVYGIVLYYMFIDINQDELQKLWSRYKYYFIQKVQKYLDKVKVQNVSIRPIIDQIIEDIECVTLEFGFDDIAVSQDSVFHKIRDLVKEYYPDLKIERKNKEKSNVTS